VHAHAADVANDFALILHSRTRLPLDAADLNPSCHCVTRMVSDIWIGMFLMRPIAWRANPEPHTGFRGRGPASPFPTLSIGQEGSLAITSEKRTNSTALTDQSRRSHSPLGREQAASYWLCQVPLQPEVIADQCPYPTIAPMISRAASAGHVTCRWLRTCRLRPPHYPPPEPPTYCRAKLH
jgi:hypothetical protein